MNIASQSNYNVLIPLNEERTLAYNSRTKAFAIWEKEDLEVYALVEKQIMDTQDKKLRDFIGGGYIVSNNFDEKLAIKKTYNSWRDRSKSLALTILPTTSCNFGCDYCTQGADKNHIKMLPEVQDAIVELVKSKAENISSLSINWFGGEPLLAPEIIISLSDRLREICQQNKLRYSATAVSNGWFLNAKIARQLYERGVKSIQITLDGSEEFHDKRRHLLGGKPTFARIINNIREAIDSTPIQIIIRVNIDGRNEKSIFALLDRLVAEGLNDRRNLGVYFAPVEARTQECHGVCDATMSKKDYGSLEVELYRYAIAKKLASMPELPQFFGVCTALKEDNLVILPSGDLHKCWETVAENHQSVGSIFALEKLEKDPNQKRWINWSPFQEKTCTQCKLLPNCAGACAQKYLNPENLKGEAALPCPSWKYNLHEKLFWRAEQKGLVCLEKDWNDRISATDPDALKVPLQSFDNFQSSPAKNRSDRSSQQVSLLTR